jgi:hypothetical protein
MIGFSFFERWLALISKPESDVLYAGFRVRAKYRGFFGRFVLPLSSSIEQNENMILK